MRTIKLLSSTMSIRKMGIPNFILRIPGVLLLVILTSFISCKKSQPATTPVQPSVTPPAVSMITPDTGWFQRTIEIYGSGFNPITSMDTVYFNGTPTVATSATPYKLEVSVPLSAATGHGIVPESVTVHANGLVSKSISFTYEIAEIVTTLAGSYGDGSLGSADGTGTSARFNEPRGIAIDAARNVYVAENGSNLIRKITPAGAVTTLAGSGVKGSADSTGTSASFNDPYALAVDASGTIYVADEGNNLIRKVSPAGVVTTLAGSGNAAFANGVGKSASFSMPLGIAVDASGNVYVSDAGNAQIRKITPAGVVTTFFSRVNAPIGIAVDASGNVYVGNAYGIIEKITPSGVRSVISTSFDHPYGLAVDAAGNIYVCDGNTNLIRRITPGGSVYLVAGGGSTPIQSQINNPTMGAYATFGGPGGVAIDANGIIYVADTFDFMIRKIFVQ